ncbi:MAG: tRNA pseudouridine(55) synthase TruB [Hydrogenophilales bacterium 16-64-46]|nr:MAG: tRNA pseudouridine(55) synthase TruB [Hydrogenophilales bacterium 12-64-13]OYZ05504.1 MAG: tRNA pseudouridine(55) synthase TruB [Hydrogenophilales bacterium 16-64-46]OZA40084.1 MAG: tRNA pseudouridine(55) synthase TruB [Hydrogenophilales bacterium 17-64-34]HQT00954.1 tRNA pseudouridine(55) synthase TruB [Thiobacillus sp.]
MKITRQRVDGVLLLNKPVGISSNAALQKAKWLLAALKAGHTGTLDPFADGLLPLCFGEATKFSGYLLESDKRYRATMRLGVTTTTGDPEGAVLAERPVTVDCADVAAALPRFVGAIEQIPPMHSALKHQGRPLYEYARAGIEIERPPRKVHIAALSLVECDLPHVVFDVSCSAGTYVRTLAQDIGEALGCGAHLTALTRTAAGGFELRDSHTLDAIEARSDPAERLKILLPVDSLVRHVPALPLSPAEANALCQGRMIDTPGIADGLMRLYCHNSFLGLGNVGAERLAVRRLLSTGIPESG